MKMFDARKTGMIGLPYGEKNYDDTLSRFHTIPACHGQTDGRTELLYQYRASKTVEQSRVRKGSPMEGVLSMVERISLEKISFEFRQTFGASECIAT